MISGLTPATLARVDAFLAEHPDYPQWMAGVPTEYCGVAALRRSFKRVAG
jgi:hypothetical protein